MQGPQEMQNQSLIWEDTLEEEMEPVVATRSGKQTHSEGQCR